MCETPLVYMIVFIAMVGFGLVYNNLVEFLEVRRYDRGYTAILVVIGVGVTLIGLVVLAGVRVALLAAVLFACSGTPMIIGSLRRYVAAREQDEKRAQEMARESLE